jgi:glycosyltransferase involved in cell wall biosynthesis
MKARVAILRGEWLNPFELQSYEPLLGSYDLFGIGARDGLFELRSVRVPVVLLRPLGRNRIARRVLGDRSARLLRLEPALSRCALVHTAETFLAVSEQAAEIRARQGFKLVLTCWENIPFLHDDDARLAIRKRSVKDATDVFIAVTEAARQALLLEGVPTERVVVQPAGVDRRIFRPLKRDEALLNEWAVPADWTTVLYCGRLIREKGTIDLIRAAAALPRTILVLVGTGPERPRLEAAARAYDVDGRIRFLGSVGYSQMPRVYATADVFCLPSVSTPYWQEQFGMVLVEAMACGIPVVTTSTGSIPEVVGDAALVVPPYAPYELGAALDLLVADPRRRSELAEAGLQRVSERYDAERVAASIADIYDRVLA